MRLDTGGREQGRIQEGGSKVGDFILLTFSEVNAHLSLSFGAYISYFLKILTIKRYSNQDECSDRSMEV